MKMLLFIFSFILFGYQMESYPTENNTFCSKSESIVSDTDDISSCCSKEWRSIDCGKYKLYEVRFKNDCSYTVKISYKYQGDHGLVPMYATVRAGQKSIWCPTGKVKQIYDYSEE